MSSKIHCKDTVIIITGKYKGKIGLIKNIFSNGKAIVKGININKKHKKPSQNQSGCILEIEAPIQISNLMIFNKSTNKPDRICFKIKNGKKIRIFKSNNQIIK
ncbi:50S ribosomal protein L24 [Sodalis-like secondary symbiont of Drepanosiphum platanoidis]|uniref:50S ribosomal protein L24 n=1 Tax=Sodalis-like secondary symbiont of Drepanosiphum platanoidis TaxID=2994493 RepID=UPI00346492E2